MNATRANATNPSGRWCVAHTIWGIAAAIALAGCAAAPPRAAVVPPSRDSQPTVVVVRHNSSEPVRSAARSELGPEAANAIPQIERPLPEPIDPGAKALGDSMIIRMGDRVIGADDMTRIGVSQLRNQSHAESREYSAFCERLAGLLTSATTDSHIEFVCDPKAQVQYQIQGTAYLSTVGGFDVWELFLSMSRSDRAFTIWQADKPIHVLRQPRAGQPQIIDY